MSTGTPRVSVIIPTFNCARYLPAAVGSVWQQTAPPVEVVIVDDGSTDETARVVAGFDGPVRYSRHSHAGISAARNHGVAAATGDYFAFLDADDLFVPDKLARQLAHLQEAHGRDISFGRVEEFVSPDLRDEDKQRLAARGASMAGYVAGAMLLGRAAFERVGPFDISYRVGEFADWFMRATDAGLRSAMLPDVVLRRRLHGGNVGLRERDARVDFARVMKSALDRRRQKAGLPPR